MKELSEVLQDWEAVIGLEIHSIIPVIFSAQSTPQRSWKRSTRRIRKRILIS